MSIVYSAGAPVRQILLCAAIVALASACGQPEVETAQPAAMLAPGVPVTVTGGEIRGAPADGNPDLVVLQGVPYAAPPIGNLRWKPPQPVVAWDGVRDATAPGPICMQTGPAWVRAPTAGEDDPESEDCLFLNIWAPKEIQAPLPVMVWIHGGGFFNGAGSLPIYDGARIAENDVVLVSINYRLSIFGFFAHPALSGESPHGASGDTALDTLRAAASEQVQAAANADTGNRLMRTGYLWAPNVDGWSIPSDPLGMYEAGLQHDEPLITGMTTNEGASVARRSNVEDPEAFESYVRTVYPGVADELLAHYGVTSATAAHSQIAHLIHDMSFAGPVRVQAESHAKVSSPVWLYHFTRVPPTALGAAVDAPYHGSELPYVFGTMDAGPAPAGARPSPMTTHGDWTETDRRLSETMIDYWTQFAATGNPNRDDLPAWPEFHPPADHHLNLGDTVTGGDGLHHAAGWLFRSFEMGRRAGT